MLGPLDHVDSIEFIVWGGAGVAAAITDGTASKANGADSVAYEAASSQHGSMCLGDAYIEMSPVNSYGAVVQARPGKV